MATYTMLWPQTFVKKMIGVVDGQPLRFVLSRGNAQTNFARFKVAPGDTLIPIHIVDGSVCPIARMEIVFKGTVATWNASASEGERIASAVGAQILVGKNGSAQHFRRALPVEILRTLRYDGVKGARALKLDAAGKLVQHTGVDGVFRLTPESGDELVSLAWI